MAPNIVAVSGADAIAPKIQEGAGLFVDLVGSSYVPHGGRINMKV